MRPQARREELAMRRDVRMFDSVTFARLCRARDYLGGCYHDHAPLENAALSRVRHADADRGSQKLLLAENQSVSDICFDLGYESLGSFSTRFRSLTGLSPAAFRREARHAFGGFASHWPLYYIPACYQPFNIKSL